MSEEHSSSRQAGAAVAWRQRNSPPGVACQENTMILTGSFALADQILRFPTDHEAS